MHQVDPFKDPLTWLWRCQSSYSSVCKIWKSNNRFSSWFLGFLRKGATQIENLSEACFRDIANTGRLCSIANRRLNLHQIFSFPAPSLTKLQLHYCYINAEKVAFQHFPRSLKKLSLEGCELFNLPADKSIFKHIDSHMPDLEELDLTRLTLTLEWFLWNCTEPNFHEKLSLINLSLKVRLGEESLPDGSLQVGKAAHSQAAGMS